MSVVVTVVVDSFVLFVLFVLFVYVKQKEEGPLKYEKIVFSIPNDDFNVRFKKYIYI